MTKLNPLEDSAQPPTKSALDLTAEQRDVLANVYRLLLSVHSKQANGDQNPILPERASPKTDGLVQPTAEPSDE